MTQNPSVRELYWTRWVIQTARDWNDIAGIIKSTGIESIDKEHRKLVEINLDINNLLDNVDKAINIDDIHHQGDILDNMYNFSDYHFKHEEKIIKYYDLPNYEKQRKQHKKFMEMLRSNIDDFKSGKLTVAINLKTWIMEWWINHINELDYSTFCSENWTKAVINKADSWESLAELVKLTNLDQIDEEHRHITEIAFKLIKAIRANDRSFKDESGNNLFDEIIKLVKVHFEHEEQIIKEEGLPNYDLQKDQHNKFLEIISKYYIESIDDRLEPSLEIVSFILSWWIGHINDVDYATFAPEEISKTVMMNAKTIEDFNKFIITTGVSDIDTDHLVVTGFILDMNRLVGSVKDNDEEKIKEWLDIFDNLIKFSKMHFEREEEIMRNIDSPLYKLHADDHQKFLNIIGGFRKDFMEGRVHVSENLRRIFLEWWIRHINEMDYPIFSRFAARDANK